MMQQSVKETVGGIDFYGNDGGSVQQIGKFLLLLMELMEIAINQQISFQDHK